MGVNPYIATSNPKKPERPYTLTYFIEETGQTQTITVDPAKIPYGDHGLEGSVLDVAMAHGIDLPHSCGGVCACSTCHIYVTSGLSSCNKSTDDEEDMLDEAPVLTTESRLGCQCVPDGTVSVNVTIPKWNRNQVKETPH